MTHFREVALSHASRLINHGPTVLVTSAHAGARNIMAAAWSMPVEFTPPRIAIVIDKNTWTRELMTASGSFGICLPGQVLAGLTHAVGSVSGRTLDKFAHHRLAPRIGPVLGVPLIEQGCAAWLECRLIREPHTEDAYDTCFAEVVAAAADGASSAAGTGTSTTATPICRPSTISAAATSSGLRACSMRMPRWSRISCPDLPGYSRAWHVISPTLIGIYY